MRGLTIGLLAGVVLASSVRLASAVGVSVVYDGFDYTNGAAVNAQNGGVGWSGAWSASSGYNVGAGLTFSNLQVSGNSLAVGSTNGINRTASALTVTPTSMETPTVNYFMSYLFKRSGEIDPGLYYNHNRSGFGEWITGNSSQGNKIQTIGSNPQSSNPATAFGTTDTYMVLSEASVTYPAFSFTSWVLTADQFSNFKTGGITEAELNAAAIGTGSSDVFGRVTTSNSNWGPSQIDGISMGQPTGPPQGVQYFDEFRMSNTSLDAVTPVQAPEPTSLGLIIGAGVVLLRRKRT